MEWASHVQRGVDFLHGQQADDGSFPTLVGAPADLESMGGDDPSIFTTVMIATALQCVGHPGAARMIVRSLASIERERLPNGVWRFWTREHPGADYIPPDVDDTACCMRLMRRLRGSPSDATQLLVGNRDLHGRFFTWILPRARHAFMPRTWRQLAWIVRSPLKLRRWLKSGQERPSWHDVDVVVNINAISLLGDQPDTVAAQAWVREIVRSARESRCDRWYQSGPAAWYSLLQCSEFGVSCFDDLRLRVVGRLDDLLDADQWDRLNPLDMAFATSVACAWSPESATIPRLLEHILAEQRADGSWPAYPVYYGGYRRCRAWGSAAITTALCVEALARAQRLFAGATVS